MKPSSSHSFLLLALLAGLLCLGLNACAAPQDPATPAAPNAGAKPSRLAADPAAPDKLILLQINDFHGQMLPVKATWAPRRTWKDGQPPLHGGIATIAGYVRKVRREAAAKGDQVLFLDTGDWYQGTPEGNDRGGMLVIEWLNRMGCAGSVVGNHDYDDGWRNLVRLVEAARFPMVAANATPKGKLPPAIVPYLKPYFVRTVGGVRVLFFGLILEGAKAVTGGDIGNTVFRDEVETFRKWQPVLEKEGDQIILLSHCGYGRDRRIAKALADVPKLRAILGGHSHTNLRSPKKVGHIRIFQTGGKGASINRIEFQVKADSRELVFSRHRNVDLPVATLPADPETAAWLAASTKALRAKWDRPLGRISSDLFRTRARRSSAAGNLVADAVRLAAGAKVGFTNKGGLRSTLQKGVITRRGIFELLPFANSITVLQMTGAQLENAVKRHFEGRSSALEISGLRVYHQGRKVTRITLADGSPLDAKRTYPVALNSYMAGQGDKLGVFKTVKTRLDTGIILRDALMKMLDPAKVLEVPTGNRYVKE